MAQPTQNHSNHVRYVPLYHFLLGAILALNLVLTGRTMLRSMGPETAMSFGLAVGFLILFWYARAFALAVQDRVIRLEMRLRLEKLLPASQFARFEEIRPSQVVALRFAGDAELPGLVTEVLAGKLGGGGAIKKRIQNWQADWMRA